MLSSPPSARAQGTLEDLVIVDVSQTGADVEVKLPSLFIGKVKLIFTDENGTTDEVVRLNVNALDLVDLTLPVRLNNLLPDTAYTVRAVATSLLGGVLQSADEVLETLPLGGTPLLDLATVDIGSSGAKVNVELPELFTGTVTVNYEDENGNQGSEVVVGVAGVTDLGVDLEGLIPGTVYTVQAVVDNLLGDVTETITIILETLPALPATEAPVAVTGAATDITTTSATLNGTVNPNESLTLYYFEYGRTAAYGSSTLPVPLLVGDAPIAVSGTASGLMPNTLYHFRLVAANNVAISRGSDATFTTTAVPPDTPNTAPVANNDFIYPQGNATTAAVLDNDTDAEGDPLTISEFSQGQSGTVTEGPDNTLVYTPGRNYRGTDSFTYTITDGEFSDTATVFVEDFASATLGTYNGLVDNITPTNGNTGMLTMKVNKRLSFTGTLQLSGLKYRFKGRFDGEGNAVVNVKRARLTPVSIELEINPFRGAVEGAVMVDGFRSTVVAKRNPYNIRSNQTPHFGKYNVVLNPVNGPGVPQGNGYLTFNISKVGKVRVVGKLSDNQSFTASAFLAADGTFPLYNGIYRATLNERGSLGGLVTLEDPTDPVDGNLAANSTLRWYKPAQTKGLYAAGFTADVDLTGSRYGRPTKGNRVFEVENPNGQVIVRITNGNLAAPITATFTWDTNNKLVATGPNPANVQVKIAPANGKMSGSFIDPGTGRKKPFRGVITQRHEFGSALFVGTTDTGTVIFSESGFEP
ncbi:Ig-like domain-containing protein [Prosthecobacter sp. SYSU 5D2]|uniref:Ig-like domain-containing protein n=1 Tax=Prosthecobacter sp. SYSU 5D2 TaxID=3134134 RepID=UPI0031FE84FA